jgi:primosomal protein N' (replication factor Y)
MIDLSLSFPDFRARENTFRLLTQAAGRAGRRSTAGEVIIQSFTPDEYSIYYAGNQDFEGFYEEEIGYRRKMLYPPFTKLVLFTVSSMDQVKAARYSQTLKNKLIALKDGYSGRLYRLLGPAPAPLYKLRKLYRYQLLLKLDSILKFNKALRKYYPNAPAGIMPRNIKLSIDVDPQDMM